MEFVDSEKMIDYITKEVMKKLQENSKKKLRGESRKEKDKVLTISFLEGDEPPIDKDLFQIDDFQELHSMEELNSYKFILVGSLSIKDLVHIGMGLPKDEVSSVIIESILIGKKVYLLREGIEFHKYQNTCNFHFYNMMKSYEEKLQSFGIDFINKEEARKLFCQEEMKESQRTSQIMKDIVQEESHQYIVREKIITEAFIKSLYQKGYRDIVIRKDTLVTPLAKDYIRNKDIGISHN